MLGAEAMLVVEPDAVIAEPMVAVAETLAGPVASKVAVFGIFAGAAEPMVVEAESLFVAAVPTGGGADVELALEVVPRMAAFAAVVAAHEAEPKVAEHVAETVVALELDPRVAERVSGVLLVLEAGPMKADLETGLKEGPKYS